MRATSPQDGAELDAWANSKSTFSGTGLGSAIAKKLVEVDQGKISLGNTLGVGMTFVVRLPVVCSGSRLKVEVTVTWLQCRQIFSLLAAATFKAKMWTNLR